MTKRKTEKGERFPKKSSMNQNKKTFEKKLNDFNNVSKCLKLKELLKTRFFWEMRWFFSQMRNRRSYWKRMRRNSKGENVHGLGEFSDYRTKPRVTLATLSSEYHIKLILGKSAEISEDLLLLTCYWIFF